MNEISRIFKEYQENRRDIEVPIFQMKQELGRQIEKICLYGAGSAGIAFLHYLRDIGIYPLYFVDINERRWGTTCEGIEIISPKQIVNRVGEDALVIVTINTDGKRYCKSFDEALRIGGHAGVHAMLKKYGVQNDIDYTYFRRVHELFHGDPYNLPSCSDVSCILGHQRELEFVYEHLADDISKDVFFKILQFRLIDDTIIIPTMPQDKQYFEYEFYPKREDEVFVDCGAFNGISAKAFLSENRGRFEAYYGFEPDPDNFDALRQYIDNFTDTIRSKMHLYNVALWKDDKGARLYSLKGPGSFIADIGNTDIQTIALDKVIDGSKVTYIKMNIEGSEIQALQGAKNTIKNNKPKLAIAGYHKTWDMWEIPNLILKYDESYKIYLRSYMNHISFVYYCV